MIFYEKHKVEKNLNEGQRLLSGGGTALPGPLLATDLGVARWGAMPPLKFLTLRLEKNYNLFTIYSVSCAAPLHYTVMPILFARSLQPDKVFFVNV